MERDAKEEEVDSNEEETRNAVMYDDDGNIKELGKNTLLNKGFKLNACVMKNKGDTCIQWVITDIREDGSVELNKVDIHGKVAASKDVECSLNVFLTEFKQVAKIDVVASWPNADPRNSNDLKTLVARSKVVEAMYQLVSETPSPIVLLMSVPEKKLIARQRYEVGHLILTPATMSMDVVFNQKECPSKSIECSCAALGARYFLHPGNTKEFINPFWHMKTVKETEKE